jgi:hypothetical protein
MGIEGSRFFSNGKSSQVLTGPSRTKSFTHEYAARPTNTDRIKSFEWPTCILMLRIPEMVNVLHLKYIFK